MLPGMPQPVAASSLAAVQQPAAEASAGLWSAELLEVSAALYAAAADHGHGFMPSYVYRLLAEFYHRQDYRILSNEMISHILR